MANPISIDYSFKMWHFYSFLLVYTKGRRQGEVELFWGTIYDCGYKYLSKAVPRKYIRGSRFKPIFLPHHNFQKCKIVQFRFLCPLFQPYHPKITKIYFMRIHNGLNIILSRFDITIIICTYYGEKRRSCGIRCLLLFKQE